MWPFNKKTTIAASGILVGATDHHSHILPGVDDGVETMDEALRILATYETLGIKELWLTPHIMEDIPNTPKKLTARFNELKAAYTGNITLHLAAEYMIDNNLHKLIQKIDSPSLLRGAVQSKPFQVTPPLFRGEVVEDRRGEKSPKEYPLGTKEESKTTSTKLLHSLEGRWHELSEVTEGNQTNNCPSYVRGASDAVAEGVDITNPQVINSPSLQRGAVRNNSTACDDGGFSTPKESPLGLTKGEGVETNKLLYSSEGAVQSKPFQLTPPLFRGEVVEDRRGEKKTAESPLGLTQGEEVEKDCSCHSDHTLTNKLKEVLGAVQSKPFQETPPLFRGEVVEDRRGEKKTTECLMRYELSEVTEGNQTNNSPSYLRGASNAVAEGVETNSLLPIGSAGKHILVETSYFTPPMRLHETLRKIKSLGYHPILAHPERYMYMEKEEYLELHEEGIKFQLNLASLAGGYGKAVKKKAEWLLSNGLYSVAGTDLHCENAIEYITNCMLSKQAIEQLGHLLTNKL